MDNKLSWGFITTLLPQTDQQSAKEPLYHNTSSERGFDRDNVVQVCEARVLFKMRTLSIARPIFWFHGYFRPFIFLFLSFCSKLRRISTKALETCFCVLVLIYSGTVPDRIIPWSSCLETTLLSARRPVCSCSSVCALGLGTGSSFGLFMLRFQTIWDSCIWRILSSFRSPLHN